MPHGGELVVGTLSGYGVREIFTLSGGHIFSIYDGAVKAGWRIVDVRHEQTATWAAEGTAKLTRRPGVAVLTAGPGITNGVSAITTAHFNGSPLVALGGRAPQARWGAGSLQELDHVPIVASITKLARTVTAPGDIPKEVGEAAATAITPHRGPVFLDFPLDVVFAHGQADVPAAVVPADVEPDADALARAAALIAQAARAAHVQPAASPAGDLTAILDGFASYAGERADHEGWIAQLRSEEGAARQAEKAELESDADPIHPARVYGELRKRLARDAVVIGDGGDFVSYAGKLVDSYEPGCWMDPGPYGCLGTGVGYAVAARVAHPDRQVVLLLGDGAIGFNGMDFDTLVRHQLPIVAIVGNNGIWGLEKHPMQAIYGYDVAADLQPGLRYDDVVKALGGAGETVSSPKELGPALDRAFAAGVPYLVNVLTDPAIAYPRSSNLA